MKNATILRHHISQERSNKIIGNYHNRVVSLHKANSQLSLYELQIVNQMIQIKSNFEPVSTDFKNIISEYITSSESIGLTSD